MILAVCVSFLLCLVFTRVLISAAPAMGLIAVPGDHRAHERPTPLVGGIATICSFLVGAFISGVELPLGLIAGMVMLLALGVVDDKYNTPFWVRFIVQIIAAVILVESGVRLENLGSLFSENTLYLGRWSYPLTVFSIVGVINAINMIDGLDGLLGTLTLITLGAVLLVSYNGELDQVSGLGILMLVCLIGFLVFNFRFPGTAQARTFLGDSGSMPLGLFLSWLLIESTQGYENQLTPVGAIWLLIIPLFDTVGVMIRRMYSGVSPFSADRRHTHHLLEGFGYTTNAVVGILAGIAALSAVIGCVGLKMGILQHHLFYLFMILFSVYVVFIEVKQRGTA